MKDFQNASLEANPEVRRCRVMVRLFDFAQAGGQALAEVALKVIHRTDRLAQSPA
jgi:hypothetical protein